MIANVRASGTNVRNAGVTYTKDFTPKYERDYGY